MKGIILVVATILALIWGGTLSMLAGFYLGSIITMFSGSIAVVAGLGVMIFTLLLDL